MFKHAEHEWVRKLDRKDLPTLEIPKKTSPRNTELERESKKLRSYNYSGTVQHEAKGPHGERRLQGGHLARDECQLVELDKGPKATGTNTKNFLLKPMALNALAIF